ncbi:MAG: hypothetical protein KGH64_01510 [Candidatus Micrarchaeota archaeon]|nr:hypothetical protein [Candidatus Micrarchaeota archaeon]MDE1859500.1 hypothetical protein [Candidatus Micrarchaeota archaeon]
MVFDNLRVSLSIRKFGREEKAFSRELRKFSDEELANAALVDSHAHKYGLFLKEARRRSDADRSWLGDDERRSQFLDVLSRFVGSVIERGSLKTFTSQIINFLYSLDIKPGELVQYKSLFMDELKKDISQCRMWTDSSILARVSQPEIPYRLREDVISYIQSKNTGMKRKRIEEVARQIRQFGRLTGDNNTYLYKSDIRTYIEDSNQLGYGTTESRPMLALGITSEDIRQCAFLLLQKLIVDYEKRGFAEDREIVGIGSAFKLDIAELKPYIIRCQQLNSISRSQIESYKLSESEGSSSSTFHDKPDWSKDQRYGYDGRGIGYPTGSI